VDKIAALTSFVASSPDDPFPLYGLAMEFRNQGREDDAKRCFQQLVDKFPDYIATYLMYGGVLAAADATAEARSIYERGIERAQAASDAHTVSELQTALTDLAD